MGFHLAENGRLVLNIVHSLFKLYHGGDWRSQFESNAGHDLDGSSMAFFSKVCMDIHPKAVHVDVNFIGEVKGNNPKDRLRHSVVLANKFGDTIGDNFGMESDLFGPITAFIESVVSLMSPELD
ncbi:hypothetical protein Nepgr_016571 [Nepenthes gracilis]|uniref:H(+)-exporting diphosphatase n=1 Tax=Nepenthes gracilis TaxID=150966 RepID=A0AAD3XSM0_NEPGR|nr:hypothetical protein Nepgr_016571 [Nepenthes gracilis]